MDTIITGYNVNKTRVYATGYSLELLDKVAEKNPENALELMLKLSEFVISELRAIEVNNESEEAMHTSLDIRIINTGVPLASCEKDVVMLEDNPLP